ncbi:MAG: ImmA/IrrE family metallo-endopeptidase [Solirubrobacteraceae bacterium]
MMNDVTWRAARAEASAGRELAVVPGWIWDGASLPVPIESIAEDHYGVLVDASRSLDEFATSADAYVSGVLLRAQGRILVDALEAARAPGRRRFTVAHELGHLVLHDDCVWSRVGRPISTDHAQHAGLSAAQPYPAALGYPPKELEANQFAAAMLMPAALLETTGIECALDLAEICSVSVAAAEKRLEYLRWRRAHLRGLLRESSDGRDCLETSAATALVSHVLSS